MSTTDEMCESSGEVSHRWCHPYIATSVRKRMCMSLLLLFYALGGCESFRLSCWMNNTLQYYHAKTQPDLLHTLGRRRKSGIYIFFNSYSYIDDGL